MVCNDPIANMLSKIENAEKIGRLEVTVFPVSKLIKEVLKLLVDSGYIGNTLEFESSKGNYMKVELLGNINKCGVIKPRHSVKKDDYDRFESRYLPAKDFGVLLVSTSQGLINHKLAKDKKLGGKLIAYCY